MNITYRKTQSGKWLVCEAKPHTLGVGVQKVGTESGGHTTGFQFGTFEEEGQAKDYAGSLARQRGWSIVEWVEPVKRNPQYIDLDMPDNDLISINSDKTIEWYRGEVLKNVDITEGKWFGYDFAIVDVWTGERLLLSKEGRYRVGDLKQAIAAFRYRVDDRLGEVVPRGRNGGRNTIADEPMTRRNISITDTDYKYAASIGGGKASAGIRVALEHYRQSEGA